MKPKKKIIAIFIIVHIFLITAVFIHCVYLLYPREVAWAEYRSLLLQEIYNELKVYKVETGAYPGSLDLLLRFDKEKGEVFFRSKELKSYHYSGLYLPGDVEYDINKYIHYRLINGEPVLTELGTDREQGGMDKALDVTYPSQYQKSLSYWSFMKTKQFCKSLVIGVVFASVMSLCLYNIWKNRLQRKTWAVLVLSIVFLVFEILIATSVLIAHIYPHH